jgi:hypothetical protein
VLVERKWKKWVYFYLPMAVFILVTLSRSTGWR